MKRAHIILLHCTIHKIGYSKKQIQYMEENFVQRAYIFKILLCSVVITIVYGCKNDKEQKDTDQKMATVKPAVIEAFVLNKSNLTTSVKIPGELVAYQQVDLYAKVNSYIKKLQVDVGSEVSAGQLLAELEAPEINAQLSGAESRLKSQEAIYLASKATYDRLFETSKTPGTISKNDLEQAYAKQRSDLAQLDAAKSNYREITNTKDYLQIRAPFSGVVTNRNVSAGAYVGPSGKGSDMPIFTLQEHKKLRLIVSVPEAYTAYISNKSEVGFSVNSLPGEKFKAKIARLAGALDTKLRSQHIEMDVENNGKKLLPGMVADVSIPLTANSNAYLVPVSAVLNSTTGVFVIALQHKTSVWLPVKTGRVYDGKTEVFGSLTTGDTILTHAGEEVRNGSVINNVSIK
jgi:RND family efflux transporter MFP subunit